MLLYKFLGWSMLAGVGVLLAVAPMNGALMYFEKNFQKVQMKAKDDRTRLTTEIVEHMKGGFLYEHEPSKLTCLSHQTLRLGSCISEETTRH